VRLATKEQSSAVVIVIWAAKQDSNPLYILRNRTPYTILCRQPLRDEQQTSDSSDESLFTLPECSTQSAHSSFECTTSDVGAMIKEFLGFNVIQEFVWVLKSNDVTCFGFDDPEKPHMIEWTCVSKGSPMFDEARKKAYLEVDAMGSTSVLGLPGRRPVRCQIGAEHSTKVIEFVEFGSTNQLNVYTTPSALPLEPLQKRGQEFQEKVRPHMRLVENLEIVDEDEDPAFSLRIDIPGLHLSVVDNVDPTSFGREILLFHLEKMHFVFSQTREGYHEFEMRISSLQVDNHVNKSIHPVLVSAVSCCISFRWCFCCLCESRLSGRSFARDLMKGSRFFTCQLLDDFSSIATRMCSAMLPYGYWVGLLESVGAEPLQNCTSTLSLTQRFFAMIS